MEIAVSPNKFPDLGPWSGAAPVAELPAVLLRLQAAVPGSCLDKPSLQHQHVLSAGVIPHAHGPARCKWASWQCICCSESLCQHRWHCVFPGKDFKLVATCGNSIFSSLCTKQICSRVQGPPSKQACLLFCHHILQKQERTDHRDRDLAERIPSLLFSGGCDPEGGQGSEAGDRQSRQGCRQRRAAWQLVGTDQARLHREQPCKSEFIAYDS